MKTLINFFSSVKLAIVLLIIITLASILGTLIPQHRSPAEYAAQYGQLAPLLIRLEVTKLYHSWWFLLLLFLFALNTIMCTITRLPAKFSRAFRTRYIREKKWIQTLKINDYNLNSETLEATQDSLIKQLSVHHYRTQFESADNQVFVIGRKKILGIFGSDFVHLGLLVIIIGAIISGFSGARQTVTLSEGQIFKVPEANFSIRLDKFETELYPNGSVKDWKSTLTVIENGADRRNKIIEVNHPLSYKGYMFYQSSYGYDWTNPTLFISAQKKSDSSFTEELSLHVNERKQLSDAKTEIVIKSFTPHFMLNENREPVTASLEPRNPAAFIEGWQEGDMVFSGWIFLLHPDFSRIHGSQETDLTFVFKDMVANPYSGIQMSYDPGANFIWVGCALLMLGLFIAFFWPTSEFKAVLEKEQEEKQVHIHAGAIAPKNQEAIRMEFEKIMASLRSSQ